MPPKVPSRPPPACAKSGNALPVPGTAAEVGVDRSPVMAPGLVRPLAGLGFPIMVAPPLDDTPGVKALPRATPEPRAAAPPARLLPVRPDTSPPTPPVRLPVTAPVSGFLPCNSEDTAPLTAPRSAPVTHDDCPPPSALTWPASSDPVDGIRPLLTVTSESSPAAPVAGAVVPPKAPICPASSVPVSGSNPLATVTSESPPAPPAPVAAPVAPPPAAGALPPIPRAGANAAADSAAVRIGTAVFRIRSMLFRKPPPSCAAFSAAMALFSIVLSCMIPGTPIFAMAALLFAISPPLLEPTPGMPPEVSHAGRLAPVGGVPAGIRSCSR